MKKTLIALAAVMSFGSTAAIAQQETPQQMQQQQTQEITEGMLVKFVTAMEDVQSVTEKYREKFQNAENQEQAQTIQQSAQEEMIAAVEGAGLTPQEYNMIIQQAQNDEELRNRLQEMTGEDS
ncbi:DUF4168 domain-containing protein [Idiomarina seosinensis]|uniref:DUF4168 domain-containing protein n=1 Tax=Idiomarina seosinensis TaxID=281739 RepID=A0A432ZEC8_9GAMM|nr:DUF4168 domain-containing protein [Idiomarina seosinensis]RUO76254.1 hypothetical protein CWI81_09105 [Idiomarina seosinensis]